MSNTFEIENFIQREIDKFLPEHAIKEIYHYAMFPAGKLFRPNLALAIYSDLNPTEYQNAINLKNKDILYFASALECHHSYSLVHDDLPAMDNDDYRRGKLSTHKKYGEWKAILVGDGLLNISYEFLFKIDNLDSKKHKLLNRLFVKSLGPKGLIHGQTLDLSHEMNLSFLNTVLTHKLKTGRLIQLAATGAAIIADKGPKIEKSIWRYSENIGILFQFLDDLSELTEDKISEHEMDINPWIKDFNQTFNETYKRLQNFEIFHQQNHMSSTLKLLKDYLNKMNHTFKNNSENLKLNLKEEGQLAPMMSLLDRINSIH